MFNIKTINMLNLLGNLQYAIAEPIRLKNIDDNYKKFSL